MSTKQPHGGIASPGSGGRAPYRDTEPAEHRGPCWAAAIGRYSRGREHDIDYEVIIQEALADLVSFATRVIEVGSTVKTDGAANLKRLSGLGYQHERFVGLDSKEPAHVNLPGVHMVASLLKRWLTGTLHYAVSKEHLAYYLDEYTFRFNRRNSTGRGLLFYRLLQQAVNTDPDPLADLRKPAEPVDFPF